MFLVTGSPALPFADAVLTALTTDAVLVALVTGGIYAALPRATRVNPPYVIVGHRQVDDTGGAMQLAGGQATVYLDTWSIENGPAETQQIQSRIRVLLMRKTLMVAGFSMIAGSLTCVQELAFPEFDPDMPERSLFHGVQQWVADLEEVA